jgi:hypothetical protein
MLVRQHCCSGHNETVQEFVEIRADDQQIMPASAAGRRQL